MSAARSLSATSSGAASDAELVRCAQRGDLDARELLFRRYARYVNGLVYRLTGNRNEVSDLVQDAFVRALGSLGRLKSPESFRPWLAGVVVRTVKLYVRRRRLLRRLGLLDATSTDLAISPAADPEVHAELRKFYKRMDELPAGPRMALLLRKMEGHKLEDVAELLGVSLATAKRWLKAASEHLEMAET